MKIEGIIFSIYAVFLGVVGAIYWILIKEKTETAGVVALFIAMGLGILIGGYLLFTARRMEPRPQDLPDAEVADGAGELGNFSPRSYWPFFIAAGLFVTLLGTVIGIWLAVIGGIFVFGSVIGLVFEQYVNRFSPEDS
jgi:hypothetical protein